MSEHEPRFARRKRCTRERDCPAAEHRPGCYRMEDGPAYGDPMYDPNEWG